ncbi:cell division protein Fic [Pantoea sp. RIT-PI-b]|uniref:Fic family protein n=1 Tax=Pantoea sp. RIT-PI-b TaxID=1681195 RepID=UPI0006769B12|nr:Fic family protein [Pantoea sp. RIT-PI-b]KNC13073.1 cell division protein Fic [Pantoea sp. RIT-PI-b]
MAGYQPPYTITPTILNQVIEVGELLGRWAAQAEQSSPLLRKENRIRTIQASLAIEHNSLSTEQVTAIMEGKRVLAPAKDIQEVRNAILAYEKLNVWQSGNLSDLLSAHRLLMTGLVDAPGQLRNGNVGVYREQQLIHMAPPANQVSRLIGDLLGWVKQTDIHPLIASSIFHYEFEFIHPFTDGNGRMGRLWQTLILSEWRTEFAWLPVETLIHNQQQHYYRVLGECDRSSDCTPFIAFMLEKLIEALAEGIGSRTVSIDTSKGIVSEKVSEKMSEKPSAKLSVTAEKILSALRKSPEMTIADLSQLLGVSSRTVERNLKTLQSLYRLQRVGAAKGGYWRVI